MKCLIRGNNKKNRRSSLFNPICFFSGCTHSVTIRPNLDVTATIANQLGFNVGLFIPPEIRGLKKADRASWADKYIFNVGESVSPIIYKALSRVFRAVELLEAYPTEIMIAERGFDFVVSARISEANVGLNVQEGFFTNDAAGNTYYYPYKTILIPIKF